MKTAVHVPTKELWNKVVQKELDKGKKWSGGDKNLRTIDWDNYKSESSLAYSPQSYFRKEGYKIISAEEYLKVELKVGDRVKANNGYSFDPSIGTIKEICNSCASIIVEGKTGVWNYLHGQYELLEEKPVEKYWGVDLGSIDGDKTYTRWTNQANQVIDQMMLTTYPPMYGKSLVNELVKDQLFINKKGKIMSAISTVKKLALKVKDNDEYQLREAGLHDSEGNITTDGIELRDMYLEELVHDKMVASAKEINETKVK